MFLSLFHVSFPLFLTVCGIRFQVFSTMVHVLPCVILFYLLGTHAISGETMANYMQRRNDLFQRQRELANDRNVTLNKKEHVVNEFLKSVKLKELHHYKSNNDGQNFPPANQFLKVKQCIESSDVFKIISKMPKGRFVVFSCLPSAIRICFIGNDFSALHRTEMHVYLMSILIMYLTLFAMSQEPRGFLTHWGRVTHICVSKLTIIGPDNGLSPGRRQAII